ncbi:MAG: hypothetical protein ABSD20_18900 [Terriglobales bacterium]
MNPVLRNVLLVLAVAYAIGSAYFIYDTREQLTKLGVDQRAAMDKLKGHMDASDREMKASTEALAQKVGMTAQDLKASMVARTSELERQQKAAEKRIAEQETQVNGVSGEVAGVKTDLGSAKTEIAATQTDLATTKAKLDRTIGDLAHDRADLDELRRRGERNYYEFTLQKGARPTPVSTVSLQLKKTDPKKNKFTLNVVADDKTIEKKDRTTAEPMQFITGRDKNLYEVVVMTVDKNKVTGYLATPKTAPTPIPTS